MEIKRFTEADIKEAAGLTFMAWGELYAELGAEFAQLMCEYIVRYGWLNEDYSFKLVDNGKMVGCVLAGKITDKGTYNEWLDQQCKTMNKPQLEVADTLRAYFLSTSPKVYSYMKADEDLYLSYFISSIPGCGKLLLAEIMKRCKAEGYKNIYLWTDSSCNHSYYAHNNYTLVSEFKSDHLGNDGSDVTYIYKKAVE